MLSKNSTFSFLYGFLLYHSPLHLAARMCPFKVDKMSGMFPTPKSISPIPRLSSKFKIIAGAMFLLLTELNHNMHLYRHHLQVWSFFTVGAFFALHVFLVTILELFSSSPRHFSSGFGDILLTNI